MKRLNKGPKRVYTKGEVGQGGFKGIYLIFWIVNIKTKKYNIGK